MSAAGVVLDRFAKVVLGLGAGLSLLQSAMYDGTQTHALSCH